jgi:hypothetical protein
MARMAGWSSVAAFAVAVSGCGGSSAPECNGATRGCVQLVNHNASEVGVTVNGGDTVVIPPATAVYPGTTWISVDPTVGAPLNFHAWTGVLSRDTTCTVKSSTWANAATPPQVVARSYPVALVSISFGNW